MHWPQNIKKQ